MVAARGLVVGSRATSGAVSAAVETAPKRGRCSQRHESVTRLQGAVSRVNVELVGAAPQPAVASAATSGETPPSSSHRGKKSVSLRFPRAADSVSGSTNCSRGRATVCSLGDNSRPTEEPASVVGASSGTIPADELLEDLRLQNAVLRKSLAMLQESVVDTMKGNKDQFVGNGFFRQRCSANENPKVSTSPTRAASQTADLERLRATLTERRAALRVALEERDAAMKEAADAMRKCAEERQHLEVLRIELEDCEQRRRESEKRMVCVESEHQAACERVSSLEMASETASRGATNLSERLHVELEGARRNQAEAEARCAALACSQAQLKSDFADNLQRLISDRRRGALRSLARAVGVCAWQRACFSAWASWWGAGREEQLRDRASRWQIDTERWAAEACAARASTDAAEAAAEARVQKAEEASRQWARETESARQKVADERARWEEADECLRCCREELCRALGEAVEATGQRDALSTECDECRKSVAIARVQEKEAAVRERAVREELGEVFKTEACAGEALRRVSELEAQLESARISLFDAHASAKQRTVEAQEAQHCALKAGERVHELQHDAARLQRRVVELEASEVELRRTAAAADCARKAAIEAVAVERQSAKANSDRFVLDARQALEDARKSIRIMVTSPKVSVNVGGTPTDLQFPFPFEKLKESVQRDVYPKFARICVLGENTGDSELRRDVHAMMEQLAQTLQDKVKEVLPQVAEDIRA
eukprot:TRINITY_DN43018_c0_g1_i1.p1 TRINITY_DN43018_c0_g1~~TRINITY_DN43018_c0_g1_i1.p1  ORF type:complete len:724 (-),score=123.49 TRINITY_DN43018_c0_g1_i1:39-2210(-)